jgi:3-deoxy-D-manno-octulosonic-acid transferase
MIWLYRILFVPALLVMGPYYLMRMRKRGGYRKNFKNRFGFLDPLPPKGPNAKRIWVQAVSVGEIFAVAPILRKLREETGCEIFLTTTTSTGYALALERLQDLTIGIGYFPIDFWAFSSRMWRQVQPDLCVLFESEIWPEHIHQATRRQVPLVLVNGRMSDRSYNRLKRFPAFGNIMFNRFARILTSSPDDLERFLAVGAEEDRVTATGNIKLDVNLDPILSEEEINLLAQRLGMAEPGRRRPLIVLGSSTWAGEERSLLRFLQRARAEGIDCRLLLVPRHAERRNEISQLLDDFPFSHHFRSAGQAPGPVDVAVGDTTGELIRFTQMADLVFVGKSLPPKHANDGGQTPIEAAAFGKAIVYGPYMTNFRHIARELVDCGGAMVVGDEVDFFENALPLLRNDERRRKMAEAALGWHARNRGAVAKTVAEIEQLLKR